jgi:predicted kinase
MNQQEVVARAESSEGKNLLDTDVPSIIFAYEEKNPLPGKIPPQKWILAVIGLVGSGKTTLLKRLSTDLSLVRIANDDIRELLHERGFNMLRTVDVVKEIVKMTLLKGYPVALDGDNITPEHRAELEVAAKAYAIPLVRIHVHPPEAFILENNQRRDERTGGGEEKFIHPGQATREYYRRKPLHEKYLSEIIFDYTFDTSRLDLPEQIEAFEGLMKERGF